MAPLARLDQVHRFSLRGARLWPQDPLQSL